MSEDKSKNDFDIKRFGRYLLLDHLVDGGMAKICRARFLGEQANKIVAIKMIQEQFSKDEAFVQMFRDELKVTFGLIHPNIAQTYDYGEVDHTLYTAMEYVDGANLKQFLDRLKKRKFVFPVEISTYIISQVCQALFYAHTFTDKLTGRTYNIIHRDVSPHNVMITYDGAVKVIDFGIAKAETNSEATQAGTIKGKLSYLAPEYLDGLELDHSYDQFAVGITLWEMLCSRKLFSAPNDLAVLKQIQACQVAAPSSINPNVPKELDEIVLKALNKDRSLRFKDMDALNRALVRFLYSKYPDFNATDLSFFAKELFKEDIKKDREILKEFGKIDIKPFINDFENSYKGVANSGVDPSTVEALIVTKRNKSAVELEMSENDTNVKFEFTRTSRRNDFNQRITHENQKIQTVLKQNAKPLVNARPVPRPQSRFSTRATAIHQLEDLKKKSNPFFKLFFVATLACAAIIYTNPEYMEFLQDPSKAKRAISSIVKELDLPKDKISKEEILKNEKVGMLYFENYSAGTQIKINGRATQYSILGIKVPLNKKLYISVSKSNHADYQKAVTLTEDSKKFTLIIPELKYQSEGVLSSRKKYPAGTYLYFTLNERRMKKKLPIENFRIPTGIYEGKIVNKDKGINRKIIIKIQKDKVNYL